MGESPGRKYREDRRALSWGCPIVAPAQLGSGDPYPIGTASERTIKLRAFLDRDGTHPVTWVVIFSHCQRRNPHSSYTLVLTSFLSGSSALSCTNEQPQLPWNQRVSHSLAQKWGYTPFQLFNCRRSTLLDCPATPLNTTHMDIPTSVANKRLMPKLTPLDATLTKNRGVAASPTFQRSTFLPWVVPNVQPSNVTTFRRFPVPASHCNSQLPRYSGSSAIEATPMRL